MYAPTADIFVAKIFENGIGDRLGWSTLTQTHIILEKPQSKAQSKFITNKPSRGHITKPPARKV